jgi:hypothetical protein
MGKIGFCSEVSSLNFQLNSRKRHCICHDAVCPLAEGFAARDNVNHAGATILFALAKTKYNNKRRNVTPVDFETFGRTA